MNVMFVKTTAQFSLCSVAQKCSPSPKHQNLGAQRGWAPASPSVPQQQRSHGGHVGLSLPPPGCCLWCWRHLALGWERRFVSELWGNGDTNLDRSARRPPLKSGWKILSELMLASDESVPNKTDAQSISCQSHHVSKPVLDNIKLTDLVKKQYYLCRKWCNKLLRRN